MKKRYGLFLFLLITGAVYADWPYWPKYSKTPLTEIRPQQWRNQDDVIEGWDWSLPPNVKPAANGSMTLKRTSSLDKSLTEFLEPLDLPVNPIVSLWIRWADLEPVEGNYKFDVLRKRIAEAQAKDYGVVLRMPSLYIFTDVLADKSDLSHQFNKIYAVNALFGDAHVSCCNDQTVFNNPIWDRFKTDKGTLAFYDLYYYTIFRLITP